MFGFLKPKPAQPVRPAQPTQISLLLDGVCVPVEVGFDRFRTMRISIRREGTVRVRAPKGTSLELIRQRLAVKADWIKKHLTQFRAQRQALEPPRYVNGETHLFLGQEYALLVRQDNRNGVRLAGDGLLVTTRLAPRPDTVRKLLAAWQAEQARELFTRVIRELLPSLGAFGAPRPSRLKVRAMKSRWGSCSRAGSITLNLHLLKAPLACIEYVAAHELCHLVHHGHNASFYGLLATIMPDWRERKKLLAAQPIA